MNLENLLHILALHISDLSVVFDLAPVAFCAYQLCGITAGENSQSVCCLAGRCTHVNIGGGSNCSDGLSSRCTLRQLQELCLDVAFYLSLF